MVKNRVFFFKSFRSEKMFGQNNIFLKHLKTQNMCNVLKTKYMNMFFFVSVKYLNI